MFNHNKFQNVAFELDRPNQVIRYRTCRPVQAGEELCIFYGQHAARKYDEVADESEEEDESTAFAKLRLDESDEESEGAVRRVADGQAES